MFRFALLNVALPDMLPSLARRIYSKICQMCVWLDVFLHSVMHRIAPHHVTDNRTVKFRSIQYGWLRTPFNDIYPLYSSVCNREHSADAVNLSHCILLCRYFGCFLYHQYYLTR